MVNEQDRWLLPLLLASDHAAGSGENFPLDRIRLQKAVFLLGRGSAHWSRLYYYKPYNWGPYSRDLTHDADRLVEWGYIRVAPSNGNRYGRYMPTPAGEHAAGAAWAKLGVAEQQFIRAVRKFVTERSFDRLLRDVYAAYPDYATESLFRQ